jgi:hypothetical protein
MHSRKYVFGTLFLYVPKICYDRFVDNCAQNRSHMWKLKLFFCGRFSLYKFWLNLTSKDYGASCKKNLSADDRGCHSVPHQHRNRRHVSNTSYSGTQSRWRDGEQWWEQSEFYGHKSYYGVQCSVSVKIISEALQSTWTCHCRPFVGQSADNNFTAIEGQALCVYQSVIRSLWSYQIQILTYVAKCGVPFSNTFTLTAGAVANPVILVCPEEYVLPQILQSYAAHFDFSLFPIS